MKKLFLVILFLWLSLNAFSQEKFFTDNFLPKNSIIASTAFLITRQVIPALKFNDQYALGFSHRIFKNFGAEASYSFWNKRNRLTGSNDFYVIVPTPQDSSSLRGSPDERHAYKFLDILAFGDYKISKNQFFHFGLGYSYCWGYNRYIKDFTVNPEPPYDAMNTYKFRTIDYSGIVCKVSYDFYFIKSKVLLGAELCYHQYFDRYYQYNLGIHSGFNF